MGIISRTIVGGERVSLYHLMEPSYVHGNSCRARNYAAYSNVFIRGRDIHRISDIAAVVKGSKPKARVIEIGGGNAFFAHLLSKTGTMEVISTDPNPKIEEYRWGMSDLQIVRATSGEAATRFAGQADIVLCTFPPKEIDCDEFARNLTRFNAAVIILARDRELCSNTYGMSFPGYTMRIVWQGISTDKLPQMFGIIANRYQSGHYPNCEFEVYTRRDVGALRVESHTEKAKMFQWEIDIDGFCENSNIQRYSEVPFFNQVRLL